MGIVSVFDWAGDELSAVVSGAGDLPGSGGGWKSERVAVGGVNGTALNVIVRRRIEIPRVSVVP